MQALTRFVMRHKLLVTVFWLAVVAAGVMTISGTTHRMTNNFAMPGQAYKVDTQIARQYGNGGSQAPYVAVLTAPPGQQAGASISGKAFGALHAAIPDARIADYATTGNRAFLTRNG